MKSVLVQNDDILQVLVELNLLGRLKLR